MLSLVVNISVWMFVSFACPVMGQVFQSVSGLVVLLIDRPTGKLLKKEFLLSNLKNNPSKFLPEVEENTDEVVEVDLSIGMDAILEELSKHPVKTRLSLTGPLIVARDLAHGKLRDRLNAGGGLPDYFKAIPGLLRGPSKNS